MRYLQENEKVTVEGGGQCTVLRVSPKKLFLGEGGQGVAYLVDYMGKKYALKWYKPGIFRDREHNFIDNLSNNITDDSPSDKFVRPQFLTEKKDGTFGYLMDLFPSDYASFTDILLDPQKYAFSGWEATINAALNIINAFRDLHRKGKSYQDLNDGGFVIRLSDGDVYICDCDNVAPNGENLGIAGKPGYMAPEIVAGGGKVKPSMLTDNYSLANILFRLLMRADPLAGKLDSARVCLTEETELELYGTNPIFVYDPNNDANRPVRGVHDNVIKLWPLFPDYIQQAFIDAFTVGVKNPNQRKPENEWLKLFVRLKGDIIQCPKCKAKGFVNLFKQSGDTLTCPGCGNVTAVPKTVAPNGYPVLLFPGAKILKGHTENKSGSWNSEDYLVQTGTVIQNPKDPSRWGIRNSSGVSWSLKEPGVDGRRELEHEKTVAIADGLEITFGNGVTIKL